MHSFSLLLALSSIAGTTLAQLVLDRFTSPDGNARGNYHGCDDSPSISCTYSGDGLRITSSDVDLSFYTQFDNGGCQDIGSFANQYLHVRYSGSAEFTISLQQNNPQCSIDVSPYPVTWDSVNAADYTDGSDIYVPLSHFNIDKSRTVGFAFKAFRTGAPTTFKLAEIVPTAPRNVISKKPTGALYFACTRPNSLAFGIDDGVPELADAMMNIIDKAGIKVTFFTVGQGLDDQSTGFGKIYQEAQRKGHQIALHSYTHPKLEGLNSLPAIQNELSRNINALKNQVGATSQYFRPPYGTEGALTRQALEAAVPNSKTINWSVDIEDWIWATGPTPEKQVDAVRRDLDKGGNLFVAHYLYQSTIDNFEQFINMAKATGKQIMRIDQCLEDPNAPPL